MAALSCRPVWPMGVNRKCRMRIFRGCCMYKGILKITGAAVGGVQHSLHAPSGGARLPGCQARAGIYNGFPVAAGPLSGGSSQGPIIRSGAWV